MVVCIDLVVGMSITMACVLLQINTLLNFKDDKQECPCPEYIREQLLDFHEDLMKHCGTVDAQQVFHICEHVHHDACTMS